MTNNIPSDGSGDKELGSVGVFPRVRHAEHTSLAMLQLEVLVRKLGPVDRFSAGS